MWYWALEHLLLILTIFSTIRYYGLYFILLGNKNPKAQRGEENCPQITQRINNKDRLKSRSFYNKVHSLKSHFISSFAHSSHMY